MAENQTTAAPETAAEPTAGRVTRIQGSVIDVEFPVGHLPDIYNALTVELANTGVHEEGETTKKITLEVEQHLGDSTVRTVALKRLTASCVAPPCMTPAARSPCRLAMSPRATYSTCPATSSTRRPTRPLRLPNVGLSTATRRHSTSWSPRPRCSKPVSRSSIC